MKSFIFLTIMIITLFLGACGDSYDGNATNSSNRLSIRGTLIDAPVYGATYRCGDIKDNTDKNGAFSCDDFPIVFYAGGVQLGKINHLPEDGYVTPHDLAGVSREEFNSKVAKIAMFLQSLDDDGKIDEVITLDAKLIKKLQNKNLVISKMHTAQINELLNQIGAVNIISKEKAIQHLRKHLSDINTYDENTTPENDTDSSTDDSENKQPSDDTGNTDTGNTDTGNTDTGSTDTGNTDTGSTDTGNNDAGDNDIGNISPTDIHQRYLQLINKARATGRRCGEYGYMPAVDPVTWNDKLYRAALEHSKDMAKSNTFSHTGSGTATDVTAQANHPGQGSTVKERIAHSGYKWHSYGENIAAGTDKDQPDEAIDGWLKSPGHCQNIMDGSFKEVGMAVFYNKNSHYKYYWTQDFGSQ